MAVYYLEEFGNPRESRDGPVDQRPPKSEAITFEAYEPTLNNLDRELLYNEQDYAEKYEADKYTCVPYEDICESMLAFGLTGSESSDKSDSASTSILGIDGSRLASTETTHRSIDRSEQIRAHQPRAYQGIFNSWKKRTEDIKEDKERIKKRLRSKGFDKSSLSRKVGGSQDKLLKRNYETDSDNSDEYERVLKAKMARNSL